MLALEINKYVGERVRKRRLEINMSQNKLAHILGLTFQQVQKYEKGTNKISTKRLFEIAKAMNTPIEYFFEKL